MTEAGAFYITTTTTPDFMYVNVNGPAFQGDIVHPLRGTDGHDDSDQSHVCHLSAEQLAHMRPDSAISFPPSAHLEVRPHENPSKHNARGRTITAGHGDIDQLRDSHLDGRPVHFPSTDEIARSAATDGDGEPSRYDKFVKRYGGVVLAGSALLGLGGVALAQGAANAHGPDQSDQNDNHTGLPSVSEVGSSRYSNEAGSDSLSNATTNTVVLPYLAKNASMEQSDIPPNPEPSKVPVADIGFDIDHAPQGGAQLVVPLTPSTISFSHVENTGWVAPRQGQEAVPAFAQVTFEIGGGLDFDSTSRANNDNNCRPLNAGSGNPIDSNFEVALHSGQIGNPSGDGIRSGNASSYDSSAPEIVVCTFPQQLKPGETSKEPVTLGVFSERGFSGVAAINARLTPVEDTLVPAQIPDPNQVNNEETAFAIVKDIVPPQPSPEPSPEPTAVPKIPKLRVEEGSESGASAWTVPDGHEGFFSNAFVGGEYPYAGTVEGTDPEGRPVTMHAFKVETPDGRMCMFTENGTIIHGDLTVLNDPDCATSIVRTDEFQTTPNETGTILMYRPPEMDGAFAPGPFKLGVQSDLLGQQGAGVELTRNATLETPGYGILTYHEQIRVVNTGEGTVTLQIGHTPRRAMNEGSGLGKFTPEFSQQLEGAVPSDQVSLSIQEGEPGEDYDILMVTVGGTQFGPFAVNQAHRTDPGPIMGASVIVPPGDGETTYSGAMRFERPADFGTSLVDTRTSLLNLDTPLNAQAFFDPETGNTIGEMVVSQTDREGFSTNGRIETAQGLGDLAEANFDGVMTDSGAVDSTQIAEYGTLPLSPQDRVAFSAAQGVDHYVKVDIGFRQYDHDRILNREGLRNVTPIDINQTELDALLNARFDALADELAASYRLTGEMRLYIDGPENTRMFGDAGLWSKSLAGASISRSEQKAGSFAQLFDNIVARVSNRLAEKHPDVPRTPADLGIIVALPGWDLLTSTGEDFLSGEKIGRFVSQRPYISELVLKDHKPGGSSFYAAPIDLGGVFTTEQFAEHIITRTNAARQANPNIRIGMVLHSAIPDDPTDRNEDPRDVAEKLIRHQAKTARLVALHMQDNAPDSGFTLYTTIGTGDQQYRIFPIDGPFRITDTANNGDPVEFGYARSAMTDTLVRNLSPVMPNASSSEPSGPLGARIE